MDQGPWHGDCIHMHKLCQARILQAGSGSKRLARILMRTIPNKLARFLMRTLLNNYATDENTLHPRPTQSHSSAQGRGEGELGPWFPALGPWPCGLSVEPHGYGYAHGGAWPGRARRGLTGPSAHETLCLSSGGKGQRKKISATP